RKTLKHDTVKIRFDLGLCRGHRDRVHIHNLIEEGGLMNAFERELAGKELVENDTEGENIAPVIDVLPLDLFGRHVPGGPDSAPLFRKTADLAPGSPQLCQTEIHDLA